MRHLRYLGSCCRIDTTKFSEFYCYQSNFHHHTLKQQDICDNEIIF